MDTHEGQLGAAGSIEPGQSAIGYAMREAAEELGDLPDYRVVSVVVNTAARNGWTLHTVIATTPAEVRVVADGPDAWEIAATRWAGPDDVARINLHPGLRRAWPRVAERVMAVCRRRQMLIA